MLLDEDPFYLLGASTRDDRQRIIELAEEKSLDGDQALFSRCSAELINPRQRLKFEIAWLPGVSPSRALTAATAASKGIAIEPLPSPLAQVNALVSVVAHQGKWADAQLGPRVLEIAELWDRIDASHVRVLLNEDRTAAGFVLLDNEADVKRALHGRFDDVRAVLTKALRDAEEDVCVQAITQALDRGTKTGS